VGITESSIVLLYLLSVVIASVLAGRISGIVASLVAVVLFNFLFTEPRFTFVVSDPQYLVTFPVLLIVALISSELTGRIRKQAEEAQRREFLTKQLYESSRALLGAQGQEDVAVAAANHLSGLIEQFVGCFVHKGVRDLPFITPEELADIEEIHEKASALLRQPYSPVSTKLTVLNSPWMLTPVGVHDRTLAVLAIRIRGDELSPVDRESIRAVVVQLALALDREEMSRREQNARIETERERLRANLLQSISHDLRSPLTAIVGSASAILEENRISETTRLELIRTIRDDARWLTGLVENLLSLTRAEAKSVQFSGNVDILEDILSSALGRIEHIHETHTIEVNLPSEPSFVQMDSGLMEQLILNLLGNAVQHTPKGSRIAIGIRREADRALVTVEDNGPGLSERALEHAFERFYTERAIADAQRGMGLGLSICRSIAEAHGGTISVHNKPEGGACFVVRVPVYDAELLNEVPDGTEQS